MSDTILSYLLLLGILIRCCSYIPLILEIYHYEYTRNIPYLTLFLELFSYILFLIVASIKKFYLQIGCLLCFNAVLIYLIVLKIKYDKYARPKNVR